LKVDRNGHMTRMSSGTIAAKGRRTGQSPWVERLGRAGLVAKGVLYAVIAILAVKVALGGRDESPDKQGALDAIAQQPFGRGLLILLAIGLAGYAVWRLAQGFLDRDNEGEDAKGLTKRGGAVARAGWYGLLAVLVVERVVDRSSGGSSNEQQTTAGVFDLPLGRYIVYAAGLAFLGAAGFNGYRAVTCKFNEKLKTHEMNDAEEAAATGLGIVGHLARMVVFALIGLFLLEAAWEFDPKEARGLDGTLMEVAQQAYGGLLLGAVAVGLMAYGLYCFAQARYRRI
jgi:Domain of Unknown Function (DUF1206)